MEIERVVINYSAALFAFDLPGLGERFRLESFYLTPIEIVRTTNRSSEAMPAA
jgi:hypothetical protein